jgi:hypothetical protein
MKAVEVELKDVIAEVFEEVLLCLLGMLNLFPGISHLEEESTDYTRWQLRWRALLWSRA